jgi:hypothetical protein
MTQQKFSSSTYYVQNTIVRKHGTLLFSFQDNEVQREFYDVEGFYVEFSYQGKSSKLGLIKSFSVTEIDQYLPLIDISPLTDLLQ